jgi:hypothetical protein
VRELDFPLSVNGEGNKRGEVLYFIKSMFLRQNFG